jgi:Flp pilus assembly protein TadD
MRFAISLIGAFLVVFLPQVLRAQGTSCKDSYVERPLPNEERARVLTENGEACLRKGKALQSIALFSELIGLDPENALAYFYRGNAYLRVGQSDWGIADLDQAIKLKPDLTAAWHNHGTALAWFEC